MTCPAAGVALGGIRFRLDRSPRGRSVPWPPDFAAFTRASASARCSVAVALDAGAGAPGAAGACLARSSLWTAFAAGAARTIVRHGSAAVRGSGARFELPVRRLSFFGPPGADPCLRAGRGEHHPFSYPLDQILVMYALAARRGVIVHAAGLTRGQRGVLCVGRSGAGKSTIARLWRARGGALISDDRVIVRGTGRPLRWRAFGTPWPGELRAAENRRVDLAAVVFLRQAPRNALTRIDAREAAERLMPCASIPWFDPAVLPAVLATCETVSSACPSYVLDFRPEPAAAERLGKLL